MIKVLFVCHGSDKIVKLKNKFLKSGLIYHFTTDEVKL